MAVGERFGFRDVECESETTARCLRKQRVGIGDGAARHVYQQTSVGHEREKLAVDEVMRALTERHRDHDDVRHRQQFVQCTKAIDATMFVASFVARESKDRRFEGEQSRFDGATDPAVADEQYGAIGQTLMPRWRPLTSGGRSHEVRYRALRGQYERQSQLGGRGLMY